jgi:hypothetical protein
LSMSTNDLDAHKIRMTGARLREGAVAKALFERMSIEAMNRINEMSQSELGRWEQALKDIKATPNMRCPSLKLENAAIEKMTASDTSTCAVEPTRTAVPIIVSAVLDAPHISNHEEWKKQATNFLPGFEHILQQCIGAPSWESPILTSSKTRQLRHQTKRDKSS